MARFLIYANICIIFAIFTLYAAATAGNVVTAIYKQSIETYRLSRDVIPTNYLIEITPYMEDELNGKQFTFDGNVEITLRVETDNVMEIILHVNKLDIHQNQMYLSDLTSVPNRNISVSFGTYNNNTHKYSILTSEPLRMNKAYLLKVFYLGYIEEDMAGLYRSYYETNGTKNWIATTQFGLTDARKAFPCFDEPSFKATFQMIINRPRNYLFSMSNTKLTSTSILIGDRYRDVFKKTPIMSTYQLALIMSNYTSRETIDRKFGVFTRSNAIDQTQFSFDSGQKSLVTLENWLAQRYSMEKLNLISIPDISFEAMENWGLITLREFALLYKDGVTNLMDKQYAATIVTHEQAHMWFGNLVTCEWWSYAWLNEGFATYFQYFATHLMESTWHLDEQYAMQQIHSVFQIDAKINSKSMTRQNIETTSQVLDMFDSISYNKGSAIIRMIEHLMGTENFQNGIRDYILTNAYKTTTPDDLYKSLQKYSSIKISDVMNTWTTQSGFPLVTVEVAANRKTIKISQKQFLEKLNNHSGSTTKWEIPLTYTDSRIRNFQNTSTKLILSRNENASIELMFDHEIEWIIFNIQQIGYYRVNYDTETWKNISAALKTVNYGDIHVTNRAQIIDDSMNLAKNGIINITIVLDIFQYLATELHYVPWASALTNWEFIMKRFRANETELPKQFMLNLIEHIYWKLGFDEKPKDTHLDILNRLNILTYTCKYDHDGCISKSLEEFNKFKRNTKYRIPVNIRPAVYCTGITIGDITDWNLMWNHYKCENVESEKIVTLNALGCTKDKNILIDYLNRIITSDDIRAQDKATALTATYTKHEENVEIILNHVLENYRNITKLYDKTNKIISGLASRISSQEQYEKLWKFYDAMKMEITQADDRDSIINALVDAAYNLQWAKTNIPIIENFILEKTLKNVNQAQMV